MEARLQKIISYLEYALLLDFSIFFILTPFFKKVPKVCFCIGILLWFFINLSRHKLRFYRGFIPANPLNKAFLFFGIACLFSIIFSLNPYHSQGIFFERYLPYAVFFLMGIGIAVNSKKNLYFLAFAFIISGFIVGFGGVRDYIHYSHTNVDLAYRLWSVFEKRIEYYGFPLYLTFFIPFNFAILIFAKHKFLKIVGCINTILLFLCLHWSGTRIGIVAVLLDSIFLLSIGFLKNKKSALMASVILISLLSVSLLTPIFRQRIKTILYPNEWSSRMPLYKSAISIFYDYPIFGVGVGMYEKVLHTPKYELPKDYPVPPELNLHAHNTYLEIAAEMGITGILLFSLIFAVFFIRVISMINKLDDAKSEYAIFLGLSATILAVLIFAFGSTIITVGPTVSSYFWFLFGMAASFLCPRTADDE